MNEIKVVCEFDDGKVSSERFDSLTTVRVYIGGNMQYADIERPIDGSNVLKDAFERLSGKHVTIKSVTIYILDGSNEIQLFHDEAVPDVFRIDYDYQAKQGGGRTMRYVEAIRFSRDSVVDTSDEAE